MRAFLGLLASVVIASFSPSLMAQDYSLQVGSPTFTTALPVENGFINVANGNLRQNIVFGSFPQRGSQPLTAGLMYDSRIWTPTSNNQNKWGATNISGLWSGWRFVNSASSGTVTNHLQFGSCVGTILWIFTFTWTAPDGTTHGFPIATREANGTNHSCDQSSGAGYATDSSGYFMSVTGFFNAVVYAPDGTQVFPTVKDPNGNFFSTDSSGNIIDTLGRTPVTVTSNCNGNSAQTCYNVLNSQNGRSTYTLTTTSINVSTAFGQAGVPEYSGPLTVVQSVALPDGTSYQFGYDSYGELNSITLPTGGTITYGYTNYQDSFGNKNRWVSSRSSGGGTWSYTPAVISTCGSGQVGCQQKVTVTKPSTDTAVYTFTLNNGAWKSEVDSYTGSTTLLSTVKSTWDFSQGCQPTPCSGASNIRVLTTTTTLPTPGGNFITNQTKLTYNDLNTMNVASMKGWKFYAGTSPTFPTTPDRETDLTYHPVFAFITNRVTQTTTKNGAGSVVAQTNFSYDDSGALQNSSPASGIQHHDDTNYGLSNTVRGNLTTVKRCTNLSSCSSNYIQTLMSYDTTGQVLSATDPKGNATNFAYADNFFNDAANAGSITNPPTTYAPPSPTNAYVTSVTPPVSSAGTTSFGYYFGTGKRAQAKDGNNADSYKHFVDALDRLTHTYGPTLGGNRPWV